MRTGGLELAVGIGAGLGGGGEALVTSPAAGTGVGAVVPAVGVVVAVAGAATAVHGGITAVTAGQALLKTGSYTNTHASGTEYHGKGSEERAKVSGKSVGDANKDPHVSTEHTPAANDREAFKQESRRLDNGGGPKSTKNYNKIDSPWAKYRKQDGTP